MRVGTTFEKPVEQVDAVRLVHLVSDDRCISFIFNMVIDETYWLYARARYRYRIAYHDVSLVLLDGVWPRVSARDEGWKHQQYCK